MRVKIPGNRDPLHSVSHRLSRSTHQNYLIPGTHGHNKYGFHWPNFTKTHNHSIQFCEHLPYRMLSTWQEKCWQYGENIIYDLKESAAVTATDRAEHKTEQRHHVGTSGTALTPSVE